MDTTQRINYLSDLYSQRDALNLRTADAISAVMTDEIKLKLDAIDTAHKVATDELNHRIEALETAVKEEVIAIGASVKAAHLHMIYSRGRVTWDGAKLDGMLSFIPQLRDARKEGLPSVSIRKI